MANAPDVRLRVRNATPGPRGGGLYLSAAQYLRLLDAAFAVVAEQGYRGMRVRAVCERAGVSSKTFYDLFADREGCFLAAFDHGVEQLTEIARPAYEAQREWVESVRAGLGVLLACLDAEPALSRLVFVEALGAGPRVLERRAEVLDGLAGLLDKGRESVEGAAGLPALTAAGVVGAAFSLIHGRLIEQDAKSLTGLLNELMAAIVLPYRGREAAARELDRPIGQAGPHVLTADKSRHAPPGGTRSDRPAGRTSGSRADLTLPDDFRLTVRRYAALSAVAELCGEGSEPCSREVRGRAGIPYEGQLSHLMMDLETRGLVENTRVGAVGTRKAWRLTARGRALLDANPPRAVGGTLVDRGAQPALRAVPRTSVPSGRPTGPALPADFRLTVRTQMALVAIAQASARGEYPSNLQVARRIGISAKAAVSRMMSRLQDQGLVENTRGNDTKGIEKAWRLTPHGQAVLDAHRPAPAGSISEPANIRGGKLVPKRGRARPVSARPGNAGPLRLTVRTQLVLTAIFEHAGASSREIAEVAGVRDEGQISKLLARLSDRGLIDNTARAGRGKPKAWRLTPRGEALLHANRIPEEQAA